MEQMELELSLQISQEALTQPPNYYSPQPELLTISQINKPDNTIENNNSSTSIALVVITAFTRLERY